MLETPVLKLPYPQDTDAPDGPAQIKALDERIEKLLLRGGQLLQKANAGENTISGGAGTFQEAGTPDKLASKLKIAAGGLIFVHYEGLWKESVADNGRAAIFIGANQLKVPYLVSVGHTPQAIGAAIPAGTVSKWGLLISDPLGLVGMKGGSADSALIATGTTSSALVGSASPAGERFAVCIAGLSERLKVDDFGRGGVCVIRGLPEGEYEIGVRYGIKESGTVIVKERKLTAWTRDPNP